VNWSAKALAERPTVWVTLGYALLTIVFAYPLSLHPGDHVMSQGTDTNLFIWTLAWDIHAFVHHPLSIFEANIFYPFHHTLAFSENLIGSALLVAPVMWLTHNPVLTMNVAALLTAPLCALGACLLGRRLGMSTPAAVIVGLVYGFSPPRFFRIDQLHLTSVEWIPFSLAYAHAYLDRRQRRDLRLALAFFTLQALTSGHAAVFLGVALGALALYRIALGEPIEPSRVVRDAGIAGALLLVPAILVLLPYRTVQVQMGLRRTLENWHLPWTSFVASPSHAQTWLLARLLPDVDVFKSAAAYLFPGISVLALALVGIVWRPGKNVAWRRAALALNVIFLVELAAGLFGTFARDPRIRIGDVVVASARHPWRPWLWCLAAALARVAIVPRVPLATPLRVRRDDAALFYTLLLAACVILTIGPPYGVWQYIYWLPGLNFIRAPSRFMILGMLALAVLAGLGFDSLTRRLSPRVRTIAAAIVVALMIGEFAGMPLPTTRQDPALPAIDRWLAAQPAPFVVAEVPVPDSLSVTVREERESIYILHSMAHWQRTIHGYSGILPEFSDELFAQLAHFPDEASLRRLREVGVTYVVVHDPALPVAGLQLLHEEADGRVYRLVAP
jgi:hypothetical protein